MEVVRTYHICDICKEEILVFNPNGAMAINWTGSNQIWPVGEKRLDVCAKCVSILALAKMAGIVTYDEGPLYRQAGFEWDEGMGCWHHPQFGLSRYPFRLKEGDK